MTSELLILLIMLVLFMNVLFGTAPFNLLEESKDHSIWILPVLSCQCNLNRCHVLMCLYLSVSLSVLQGFVKDIHDDSLTIAFENKSVSLSPVFQLFLCQVKMFKSNVELPYFSKVTILISVGSQSARCPSVMSECHHPLTERRRLAKARRWR